MTFSLGLRAVLASALIALGGTAEAQAPGAPPPNAILLRPAQVWTPDEPMHPGWVVLVQGQRIVATGPAGEVAVPPGAQVIDLPGQTLIPGLMDLHSHLLLHPYNEALWDDQVLKEPPAYRTLRDLGTEGAGYADV